jgi:hypothetical protein
MLSGSASTALDIATLNYGGRSIPTSPVRPRNRACGRLGLGSGFGRRRSNFRCPARARPYCNVGIFGSSTFEKEKPFQWKIDDLINGAAAGGTNAILGNSDRHRADSLAKARQRIHAGRMLLEFPQGVPDLRPEEAREAKAVADLVVRRILDWLEKTSPPAAS